MRGDGLGEAIEAVDVVVHVVNRAVALLARHAQCLVAVGIQVMSRVY